MRWFQPNVERLEHLVGRSVQRLGLSATQRPLEEVARYLGGAEVEPGEGTRRAATFRRLLMPEGDTAFRAARALHKALARQVVTLEHFMRVSQRG
jgi:Lhr-like helicase